MTGKTVAVFMGLIERRRQLTDGSQRFISEIGRARMIQAQAS